MQRPPRGDQGKRYPQALNRINITEWCKKVTGKYSHNTDNQVVQSELIRGGNTIFKMLKRKDKQWFLNTPEQGDKPDFRGSTVSIKTQFQYSEKYLCGRVTKNLTPHRMH